MEIKNFQQKLINKVSKGLPLFLIGATAYTKLPNSYRKTNLDNGSPVSIARFESDNLTVAYINNYNLVDYNNNGLADYKENLLFASGVGCIPYRSPVSLENQKVLEFRLNFWMLEVFHALKYTVCQTLRHQNIFKEAINKTKLR